MDQFELIRRLDENDAINIFIGEAIKALWTDPGKIINIFYFYLGHLIPFLYLNLMLVIA